MHESRRDGSGEFEDSFAEILKRVGTLFINYRYKLLKIRNTFHLATFPYTKNYIKWIRALLESSHQFAYEIEKKKNLLTLKQNIFVNIGYSPKLQNFFPIIDFFHLAS